MSYLCQSSGKCLHMWLPFIMRVRRNKERRKSDYKSPGTTQVWVDTGAYRCVVLRGLLSCCSASFLQLVFSGVEAFVVKLAPQIDTSRPMCLRICSFSVLQTSQTLFPLLYGWHLLMTSQRTSGSFPCSLSFHTCLDSSVPPSFLFTLRSEAWP